MSCDSKAACEDSARSEDVKAIGACTILSNELRQDLAATETGLQVETREFVLTTHIKL